MKGSFIHIFICFLLLTVAPLEASGKDGDPPEPGTKQAVPPPPGLPIDFGISALIAAGIGLGVFHLKTKHKD